MLASSLSTCSWDLGQVDKVHQVPGPAGSSCVHGEAVACGCSWSASHVPASNHGRSVAWCDNSTYACWPTHTTTTCELLVGCLPELLQHIKKMVAEGLCMMHVVARRADL